MVGGRRTLPACLSEPVIGVQTRFLAQQLTKYLFAYNLPQKGDIKAVIARAAGLTKPKQQPAEESKGGEEPEQIVEDEVEPDASKLPLFEEHSFDPKKLSVELPKELEVVRIAVLKFDSEEEAIDFFVKVAKNTKAEIRLLTGSNMA